ncbi:hypothetical protein C2S51_035824 [Perilla frutescens var. frutescens]|nr:hypothetical protein C2S51_035824 [Perilla frutescens var. frutescens]
MPKSPFNHFKSIHTTLSLMYHRCSIPQLNQIHSNLIVSGQIRDSFFAAKLGACFAIFDLSHALALLRLSSHRSVSIWNTVIRASSQNHRPQNAFLLCKHMIKNGVLPDNYTFSFVFRACAQLCDVVAALMCHSLVIKLGWERYDYVQNGLVHCYACCESVEFARNVFDESSDRDVITWTAVINGYLKIREIGPARELFDEMPNKNAASWSSMINGYAQMGMFKEALETFNDMLISGIRPNLSGIVGAVTACTYLGALAQGMWIHAYIDRSFMELDGVLGTALVDMYAKCGCIAIALDVFEKIPCRDVFAYTSLVSGLANHGESITALEVFRRMEDEGVEPNEVTFICVLSACSRAGLVEEGLRIFRRMTDIYGIEARPQHYGCLVDLLGRVGLLEQAEKVVRSMSVEADAYVVGALLNACRVHGNMDSGKALADGLSEHSGVHVLVSNIYASLNKWEDVERVRKEMAEKRVKKVAGCSLVEVDGVVFEFGAGERS